MAIILIIVLLLFKGIIFRWIINYEEIGERSEFEITNQQLLNKIELRTKNQAIDIGNIANIAKSMTVTP